MYISLVIATYNSEQSLVRTLPANLGGPCDEIIIIDGFSTDNSKSLASDLSSEDLGRIVFHQTPRKGLANARNIGTKLSSGEFIMHAGPDNELPDHTIKAMLNALERFDLVSCGTELVEINTYWDKAHSLYKMRYASGEQSVVGTPYMARRELFEDYPFNEAMLNSDDTELCQRLLQDGKRIYRCPETCLEFGFSTVPDFKERWMRWGRGDGLFYNKMKSQWPLWRRIKSMLRPFFAELVEPKAKLCWSQYVYCFPFLLMVFGFRYYGWIRYAIKTRRLGKYL